MTCGELPTDLGKRVQRDFRLSFRDELSASGTTLWGSIPPSLEEGVSRVHRLPVEMKRPNGVQQKHHLWGEIRGVLKDTSRRSARKSGRSV
ncbi:UNVERIFIED_CONTAM: hypothetical protein Slati_2198300 [Sesamum latifolium]|uniref:Uncharacterized protein n=1 Tax=Sesamum latifolium TaxID=2727402 RepID=A0AAW2WU09_9LAMI